MTNAPVSLHQFLRMLDSDPPKWEGKALMDPRFTAEYTRTPHHKGYGAHSFIGYMKTASEPFKEYVHACLKWAQDNPGEWRPGWIEAVRAQISVHKAKS